MAHPSRTIRKQALAAAVLLLGACSTVVPSVARPAPGGELIGRSLTVQAASGQTTTLSFHNEGRVTALFGTRRTEGSWTADPEQLCFTWAQNFRECWPYDRPFERGETVSLRSDRGNEVRVTLN